MDIIKYTDDNLHKYAQRIADETSQKIDEHSLGKVQFYMSLRRILDENANFQDIGLMDAINDTLQDLGIVEAKKTFYNL
ncbi:MAG: hypothetical protein QGI65_08765 [SAR324 cluster bacterium]|jgi:hypothetical protein|nr:hypothetical protein [SAR324 cluster bacterium]MDP6432373.1 hypothetical protein [SAR324 cluster bacterium]|tara:strand:- start:292 stop:528 length:237 start_codon:yes stop_codon:yes gene_type:complete